MYAYVYAHRHSHEYVVSGSDCGHAYVWHKERPERLEAWLEADTQVVNCLEPHPFEGLTLATSGTWLQWYAMVKHKYRH